MKNLIKNVRLFCLLSLLSLNVVAEVKPGSVIYGVVPCLFGNECFQGTIARLPQLKEQGVDILWISPVFKTDDESIISYGTTDYFSVRPDFGTDQQFKDLVQRAHENNMKVIMDIVPNHTSDAHPFFEDETYFDFYDRDENGDHTFYFDWEYLPNLNYNNPKVRAHIKEAFLHWMNIGVDGFRVDAAWGVKERAPDFWPSFIKELRAKNKDVIMLAEASAMDPYYVSSGFDFAYDWTEDLGIWAWGEAFKDFKKAPQILNEALKKSNSKHVARFLNNNDTGKRFISRYGVKMLKLSAVLMHTVPGIPIVYTGDEVGAEFDPYLDPPPLSWENRYNLKEFFTLLAELREGLPALHSGTFHPLHVSEGVYLYSTTNGPQTFYVALNFMNTKMKVRVNLPSENMKDLLTNKNAQIKKVNANNFELTLNAKDALILY